MKDRVYTLKSGKQIAFSTFPKPREGSVVFFTNEEWAYIRAQGFTAAHKDFLWDQKYRDFRYPIIPEKGLTEPEVAAKYLADIKKIFRGGS